MTIFLTTLALVLSTFPSIATEVPSGSILPEIFVGTYSPLEFNDGGTTLVSDQIDIHEISIRVDKASNTLMAIITKTKNSDSHRHGAEGDYFLVPFFNINLEPKLTLDKEPEFCKESIYTSRSTAYGLETVVVKRTKWDCSITVKKATSIYRIEQNSKPGEIVFSSQKKNGRLNTFRFLKVQ